MFGLERLRWFIDVQVGHRMPDWMPDVITAWWYRHVCWPAGMWETRDENFDTITVE